MSLCIGQLRCLLCQMPLIFLCMDWELTEMPTNEMLLSADLLLWWFTAMLPCLPHLRITRCLAFLCWFNATNVAVSDHIQFAVVQQIGDRCTRDAYTMHDLDLHCYCCYPSRLLPKLRGHYAWLAVLSYTSQFLLKNETLLPNVSRVGEVLPYGDTLARGQCCWRQCDHKGTLLMMFFWIPDPRMFFLECWSNLCQNWLLPCLAWSAVAVTQIFWNVSNA